MHEPRKEQATPDADAAVVLSTRLINVSYTGREDDLTLHDVSIDLRRGEILGVAGESGSGKSTLALALTALLREPAKLVSGEVLFRTREEQVIRVSELKGDDLR